MPGFKETLKQKREEYRDKFREKFRKGEEPESDGEAPMDFSDDDVAHKPADVEGVPGDLSPPIPPSTSAAKDSSPAQGKKPGFFSKERREERKEKVKSKIKSVLGKHADSDRSEPGESSEASVSKSAVPQEADDSPAPVAEKVKEPKTAGKAAKAAKDSDRASPAARVSVDVLEAKVGNWAASSLRPKIVCEVSCTKCGLAPVRTNPVIGTRVEIKESFAFEPYDIATAGVCVRVLSQHAVRGDTVVGQVVIPLLSLIEDGVPLGPSMFTFEGALPSQQAWFQLLPVDATNKDGQFVAARNRTGYGMSKPSGDLGFVQLKLQIDLLKSLASAYVAPLPSKATCVGGGGGSGGGGGGGGAKDDEASLNPAELKASMKRLACALGLPTLLASTITASQWENPGVSIAVLAVWTFTCLFARLWMAPLYITAIIAVNGWAASSAARAARAKNFHLWVEDTEKDPQGALAKLRQVPGLLRQIQSKAERVSVMVESAANAWNWSDPRVTILALLGLTFVSTIASLVLLLVSVTVGLGKIIFLVGLLILSPPVVRSAVFAMARRVGGIIAEKTRGGEAQARTAALKERIPPGAAGWPQHLLARVPTEADMAHRYVCDMQRRMAAEKAVW